jgi:hypothetical protein
LKKNKISSQLISLYSALLLYKWEVCNIFEWDNEAENVTVFIKEKFNGHWLLRRRVCKLVLNPRGRKWPMI